MKPQEFRFFHRDNELLIVNNTVERVERDERRVVDELFSGICNAIRHLGSIQVEIQLSSFISAPQIKTANIFFSLPERVFYAFAHYQKTTSSSGIIIDLLFEWHNDPETIEGVINFFSPEIYDFENQKTEEYGKKRKKKKEKPSNTSALPPLDMNKLMDEIKNHKNKS